MEAKTRKAIRQAGTDLQLSHMAVKVSCHDAFAKQLEAAHFGFDQTSSVLVAPLLFFIVRPADPLLAASYCAPRHQGTKAPRHQGTKVYPPGPGIFSLGMMACA
jgi:hypothetical protein